jgi:hypothetical protein
LRQQRALTISYVQSSPGTSVHSSNQLSTIPYGAAVIGMLLVARSADRQGECRLHIANPPFVGTAGLVHSMIWEGNTTLAMLGLMLATMGILTTLPLLWSLPPAFLAATGAGIAMIRRDRAAKSKCFCAAILGLRPPIAYCSARACRSR